MNRDYLVQQIREKRSYLCVGLDTDMDKIPPHLRSHPDPIFEFNRQIIDATRDLCVAYKINTAFYEARGARGWEEMDRTVKYIPSTHFKIADAKRGDIGNTSHQYARAFFETLSFDAVTVAPYMGSDSIRPFLDYEGKWTIVLGLTSNSGAGDFELQRIVPGDPGRKDQGTGGIYLYEKVITEVSRWGHTGNLMFVAGATRADQISAIRDIIPGHFLLVPGIGFQGGSLAEISKYGLIPDGGLLVNASRAILYAGSKEDFAEEARGIALQYQTEMAAYF